MSQNKEMVQEKNKMRPKGKNSVSMMVGLSSGLHCGVRLSSTDSSWDEKEKHKLSSIQTIYNKQWSIYSRLWNQRMGPIILKNLFICPQKNFEDLLKCSDV